MLREISAALIFLGFSAAACGTGINSSTTGAPGGAGMGGSTLAGPDCGDGCSPGLVCCAGHCVNPLNDVLNCGKCAVKCGGDHPFCDQGKCGAPACSSACGTTACCGAACCGDGQLCCALKLGKLELTCSEPVQGTCPIGCVGCP